jgi:hypothetical protein
MNAFTHPYKQPGQRRQHRAIRVGGAGPGDLAAQHHHLVAQHHDLHVLGIR